MGLIAVDALALRVGMTVGVAVLLALVSWRFNARIDNLSPADLHDGQTAVQVAIGVTYTIAGYGFIVAFWTTWLVGVLASTTLFLAFAISGYPMYRGDAVRSRRRRLERRDEHD